LRRCLVPLLDAVGWRGDHGDLAVAMPDQPEAMDLADLVNTMAQLKYEGHSASVDLARLDARALPCLFLGAGEAPRVLVHGAGGGFLAYDGARGAYLQVPRRRARGTAMFFRPVSGEALALLDTQPDWFARVLGRFRSLLLWAMLLSLVLSLLALASPTLVSWIYGQMTVAGSAITYAFWGCGVALFLLATTGVQLLRAKMMGYTGARLGHLVGSEVMRRLLYLPPSYTETAPLGAQLARIRDFETVRDFFSGPAIAALMDMPFIVILMVGMVFTGGTVAYVPLAAIVLFVALGLAANQVIKRGNTAVSAAGAAKQEFTLEVLTSLAAIKNAGMGARWRERYRDLSAEAAAQGRRAAFTSAVISAASAVLVSAAGIATVAVGVMNVLAGRMTMAALMGCMFLVWRILAPLRTGFVVMTQVDRIRKSVAQLNRFITMPLESRPVATVQVHRNLMGAVSLSQVSIRYSADAFPALLGLDLTVAAGQVVALVGHDGAGKTSVLKLILGMYVPQAGRILIDGMNVRQLDPIALRRSIAYAPQGVHLFHVTVAENLRLSHPAATDEDLPQACERAGVLSAVKALPHGLDTVLDEAAQARLGQDVSRRLCLARAWLRPSRLVLLDEPERGLTSTADLVAEIRRLKGSVTFIIVTHNPGLLDLADQVLWLDRGRVRQLGPAAQVVPQYFGAATS
jgi:ATP-binding cassette subfamily C protein/ATP-binding cassette subfamily C protein LapB